MENSLLMCVWLSTLRMYFSFRQRVAFGKIELSYPAAAALGATAYFAFAKLGLALASLNATTSPIWPASGLAVAMIYLLGPSLWPAIAIGAFLANLNVGDAWLAFQITTGNTLEGIVGGYILAAVLRRQSDTFVFARTAAYTATAGFATMISATTGVAALVAMGSVPFAKAADVWLTWWVGDANGILVIAPLLVQLRTSSQQSPEWCDRTALRVVILGAAAVAVVGATLWMPLAIPAIFLCFPLMMLTRLWLGSTAALFGVLFTTICLTSEVMMDRGPFISASLNDSLLMLQIFLATLAICVLLFTDLHHISFYLPVTALVLACTCAATVLTMETHRIDRIDALNFAQIVDQAKAYVRERTEVYLSLMRGGRALFDSSESVTRKEWRTFVQSLSFTDTYPGIKGMGIVFPVAPADLAAFLADTRADSATDFDLKTIAGSVSTRPPEEDHLVITYIEPLAENLPALGLDIASEQARRNGALAARDSGEPALSGRVTLVQDETSRTGYLLYLPFYDEHTIPRSLEDRRRHFRGLVYVPFVLENLLREALRPVEDKIAFRLYEGAATTAPILLDTTDAASTARTVEEAGTIRIADREFSVVWQSRGQLALELRWQSLLISLALVLVGALVASLITNLLSLKVRANIVAAEMTKAFAASNTRMRDAIAVMGNGFAMFDANDRLVMHNDAFLDEATRRVFGDLTGVTYEEIMRCFAFAEITAVDALPDREKWLQWRMDMHRHPPVDPLEIKWTDGRWMRVLERRTADGGTVGTWTDVTQIKVAEERLRAAVNAMEDGFGLFDADDRIILHNDSFLDEGSRSVFGSDVRGRKFEEIVRAFAYRDMLVVDLDPDREAWISQRMERHRNPPPVPIEVKWSGNRWMRISERRTPDGGYVGIWSDISAVKLAEERLRTAIDAMDSGFALFDADDRLIIHNMGFIAQDIANSFGGDACGRSFEEIMRAFVSGAVTVFEPEPCPEEWVRRRVEVHRNPPAEPFDQQLTNNKWCRISERRTIDGGYVCIWTDITSLKLAQARLADAIESINEAFVLIDADDRYVIFNRHFIDMYPKSGKLVRPGAKFEEVLRYAAEQGEYPGVDTPAQIDAFVKHWVEFYARREPYIGERQLADGRWVLVSHRPTSNGGYVSIRTDITRQKQREAELQSAKDDLELRSAELVALAEELEEARGAAEQANLGKSLFLASMSHELRTPLNAINGFSEILVKGMFGPVAPARYQEYAQLINQSGQHLLSLINDVLDISKIEAGKMDLHIEELPTDRVAVDSVASIKIMADEHGVELKTEIARDCPIMHGDSRAVRQIMLNLLSNAIKFTPSGGLVTLAISSHGSGVQVTISDTGIGMTGEEMKRALELYGQVESHLAKRRVGTGLGLPLVKSLIELHGGQFRLDSEKWRGTIVSVVFPWIRKHSSAQENSPDDCTATKS